MAVQKLAVAYLEGNSSVAVGHGPEEASQTFENGSLLIADVTSGEVEQAAGEPVALILGISHGPASTVTGTDVMYTLAGPNTVFEGNIGTSVTAGDIAADDLFEAYPMNVTSEDWFVDKTDNSNPCVQVVGFRDAIGTTNGRIYFKFLTSTLLYDS